MEIEINGRRFGVITEHSANRNGIAKLRDGAIVISLPSRWSSSEKERVRRNLLKRAVRAIARGRWAQEERRLNFSQGQRISAMGNEFLVSFSSAPRFRSRTVDGRIEVGVVEGHPELAERSSRMVRRELEKALMPRLRERVERMNEAHFGARLGRLSLRDNSSRWGSCSPDGSISLNLRLLFMPEEILDYVIAHELAHTRYRSHGPRFWALVGKVVPDHLERRRWLRENGWKYPLSTASGAEGPAGDAHQPDQRSLPDYFCEEPY